jgi:glycosyltransferase involved in cell wall biosynthesis
MARVVIIIPTVYPFGPDNITYRTLMEQTWRDFEVLVVHDKEKRGAAWTRNQGLRELDKDFELIMFCDDDIRWHRDAFEKMIGCLDKHSQASYVYCGYHLDGRYISMHEFSDRLLKRMNYISTMAIVRKVDFPTDGFDENLQRFQDWDIWLRMLKAGKVGVYCGEWLFSTDVRPGLTYGNTVTPAMADRIIKEKFKGWIEL